MMSWDVLANAAVSMQVTLILLWIIGAAAIVLSSLLRGTETSICHGLLGLTGMMLWLFQIPSGPKTPLGILDVGISGLGVVPIFQLLFLLGMIVATNIRLRLSPQLTIRIVQGICSGGFLIFSFVLFVSVIRDYSRMSELARSKLVGDFMFIILIHVVSMAAAILAVIHASAIKIRKDTLSWTSLGLIYGTIACGTAYKILRPAMLVEQPGLILKHLNIVLLIVPIMFLFCSGLIGFVCGLSAKIAASPKTTQPARAAITPTNDDASVQGRLNELGRLKAQNLITDEEYAAKRGDILGEL